MSESGFRQHRWPLAGVLAVQLLLVLPFLGQPPHMDDSIYLDIGQNALTKPWHPHDFPYCFEGYCAADMASHSHPPFVGYWLALLLTVLPGADSSILGLHLGYLPFTLLFAVAMYSLSVRFTPVPWLTALLSIASPAAVVMSHNLMADYPNLAFWTAALACYVSGVDKGRPIVLWVAGGFLSLAAFTSYPSLLAALLCWFYAWLRKSRITAAWWAPALPFVWIGLWIGYSSIYFGRFVLAATTGYFLEDRQTWSLQHLLDKGLSFPVFMAGTVALPLYCIKESWACVQGRLALVLLLAGSTFAHLLTPDYEPAQKWLLLTLVALGAWSLAGLIVLFRRHCENSVPSQDNDRRDAFFLAGWMATVAFCLLAVYAAASARYLLPLIPPYVLLGWGYLPGVSKLRIVRAGLASAFIALLTAFSLSYADLEMARVHWAAAEQVGTWFQGWESRIRFSGEWGFRRAMQARGFRTLLNTSADLHGGDIVVFPRQAVPHDLPQDLESMKVSLGQKSWNSGFPLRTMNRDARAGFYSTGWGFLPFSFSKVPLEELSIYQIHQVVEILPETQYQGCSDQFLWPLPSPSGGVDLQVGYPGILKIPNSLPLPAQVEFSWTPPIRRASSKGMDAQKEIKEGDLRVGYRRVDSAEMVFMDAPSELIGPATSDQYADSRQFRLLLPAGKSLEIILIFGDMSNCPSSAQGRLGDWRILPPGWRP